MATNPLTLTNGTTADANDVEAKINPLYTDIDETNVDQTTIMVLTNVDQTVQGEKSFTTANGIKVPALAPTELGGIGLVAGIMQFHNGTVVVDLVDDVNAQTIAGIKTFSNTPVFSVGITIAATNQLFLDGGGNTHISETSADKIRFTTGGTTAVDISNTIIEIQSGRDLSIAPTKRLFLDSGINTYFSETSDNTIRTVCGTVPITTHRTTSFDLEAGIGFVMPAIDPPTANQANQNSIVKGWVNYFQSASPTISDSYNVSSVTDGGLGDFTVNWDTDFGNNAYVLSWTPTGANIGRVISQTTAQSRLLTFSDFFATPADESGNRIIGIGDQ